MEEELPHLLMLIHFEIEDTKLASLWILIRKAMLLKKRRDGAYTEQQYSIGIIRML